MASKREKAPDKRMRKIALVICEGETEAGYLNLIKKWYRSPIRIVSHVEGSKITKALVDKSVRSLKLSDSDKVDAFLMYDMDVPAINEKLSMCNAEMLLSNPCFEVWLLLHSKGLSSPISSDNVIKELKKSDPVWLNYTKATYTDTQKSFLESHVGDAVCRAKKLNDFQNPSSRIYKLLELLREDA